MAYDGVSLGACASGFGGHVSNGFGLKADAHGVWGVALNKAP